MKFEIADLSEKQQKLSSIHTHEDKWTMTKVYNLKEALSDACQNPEFQIQDQLDIVANVGTDKSFSPAINKNHKAV